jgi:hypothetical protein
MVPSLRAMFNDAASARGGRLIERNPFAGLGLRKGHGNRHGSLLRRTRFGRSSTSPGTLLLRRSWLEVACFTAMRPGELDALGWSQTDFDAGLIEVNVQSP